MLRRTDQTESLVALTDLGKRDEGQNATLGLIFRRARNRLHHPAGLRRLIVDPIDKEEWHRRSPRS
ncbi:hypothetical protein [Streptomyces canus]|uniref:hypothetical protein n=1 Tax=Streptomyces canus TaxID=58343 RepID=UPI00225BAF23|nr:hypothetical protein [Streptomyces canus]MCX4859047.1 hypothetical protein [Streptomyces canus]